MPVIRTAPMSEREKENDTTTIPESDAGTGSVHLSDDDEVRATNIGRLQGLAVGSSQVHAFVSGIEKSTERLSKADPHNIQEIAASQIELMTAYHTVVIDQAKRSFTWALIAAMVGLLFFIAAIGFLLSNQSQNVATISVISGALVEVIAAINFYLYGRTSEQFADFQNRLDRTQRHLLANSIITSMQGDSKEKAHLELVRTIAEIQKEARIEVKESPKD